MKLCSRLRLLIGLAILPIFLSLVFVLNVHIIIRNDMYLLKVSRKLHSKVSSQITYRMEEIATATASRPARRNTRVYELINQKRSLSTDKETQHKLDIIIRNIERADKLYKDIKWNQENPNREIITEMVSIYIRTRSIVREIEEARIRKLHNRLISAMIIFTLAGIICTVLFSLGLYSLFWKKILITKKKISLRS